MLSADNTLKCHLEVKNSLQEFFMFCTWRKKKKKSIITFTSWKSYSIYTDDN